MACVATVLIVLFRMAIWVAFDTVSSAHQMGHYLDVRAETLQELNVHVSESKPIRGVDDLNCTDCVPFGIGDWDAEHLLCFESCLFVNRGIKSVISIAVLWAHQCYEEQEPAVPHTITGMLMSSLLRIAAPAMDVEERGILISCFPAGVSTIK